MCICSSLEVRGPAFRHVCRSCYLIIKQSPAEECIADCHRLQEDTPYYVVCILCYETTHEHVRTVKAYPGVECQTVKTEESLPTKLKKAAKRAV